MKQQTLFPSYIAARIAVVLGAGASRAVSYADEAGWPSPLDGDCFDLLQALDARRADKAAIERVLEAVRGLPVEYWRSARRAHAALAANAALVARLSGGRPSRIMDDFARAQGALWAKAHGKRVCAHHERLLGVLHGGDAVISLVGDGVARRALGPEPPPLFELWRGKEGWRGAYQALRESEAVVVWGCSLEGDLEARELFRLGLAGRGVKLCVIDPAEESRRRWRALGAMVGYAGIGQFWRSPPRWWRLMD